ncbi:uncharacterized protein Z518_05662 [Rhinocladiella mackenziei CBS 650.93]|uniref:beta-glucosidase n=1 Tax=Rhinocladiella mackenziei CBS 650.93 TaxID=1442369 RepID=A0A0D2INT4_9EURO|nr:uncharacterized protein Z518_05662 [Rhinocladiella mackenziei CBS 650.93]KIX04791.1 hypothetical protein Z518_05662 [Rhinocladiella mackenziei CBS 650.93]
MRPAHSLHPSFHRESQTPEDANEKQPPTTVQTGRDFPEDRALNRLACAHSIVVLKNDNSILPLPKILPKIALIGSHVRTPAISGGGSAALLPYYSVSLYDAVAEAIPEASITYEVGAYAHKMLPVIDGMLHNAVINFYNEPATGPNRKLLGQENVSSTSFQLMDYNGIPELNKALFWGALVGDFVPDATGTWDFGLTVFGTANLYFDDELTIDNTTHQTRGTAFFGKGTVEKFGSKELNLGRPTPRRRKPLAMVNFGGGAAHLGACLRMSPVQMIERAVRAARNADHTVIYTGLGGEWESEGFDRPHMDLPRGVDEMITQVLTVAPNAVIVNQSGTPVTMPWADQAKCIVQAWYGGNETGHGISDVLFGHVNSCAKLPLSWPIHVKHNPAYLNDTSVGGRVLYGEDVYVGYKFYDKTEREVLFPFGHGLSYTTFELSDPEVRMVPKVFTSNHPSVAVIKVKNTGSVAGAQVLQLYVAASASSTPRPVKELHGFEKVFLQAGEEKEVHIPVDRYATSFRDEAESMWKSEEGPYEVLVGTSSQEILGKGELIVPQTRYWLGL